MVSDIDGVLTNLGRKMDGVSPALEELATHGVQLFLVSNNGGCSEEDKASRLCEVLSTNLIKGENVFLCHSPLRSPSFLEQHRNQTFVVTAWQDSASLEVAEHYRFRDYGIRYLTVAELACLYFPGVFGYLPMMTAFKGAKHSKAITKTNKGTLRRFGYQVETTD